MMPTNGDNIYGKNLHEQDLTGLAKLCTNVALNLSAERKQGDTAHALHVEWTRLRLDTSLNGNRAEAEASLQKRMAEFLAGVPAWIWIGL
jgi:hypothetical protein